MNKEQLREMFDIIIENYDKYNITFEMKPNIEEMINWDGTGIRFTKYERIIKIEDKIEHKEKIKKEIW